MSARVAGCVRVTGRRSCGMRGQVMHGISNVNRPISCEKCLRRSAFSLRCLLFAWEPELGRTEKERWDLRTRTGAENVWFQVCVLGSEV